MAERPYTDVQKPGRVDTRGEEWWACDPYPTWFRWEEGVLKVPDYEPVWPDELSKRMSYEAILETPHATYSVLEYLNEDGVLEITFSSNTPPQGLGPVLYKWMGRPSALQKQSEKGGS